MTTEVRKHFASEREAVLHWHECNMLNAGLRNGSAWKEITKPFDLKRERAGVLRYLKKIKSSQVGKFSGLFEQAYPPASSNNLCYFIQCGEFVKIGFTNRQPSERLSSLQTGTPYQLTLLATVSSNKFSEGELHQRFAELRHRGEWFIASSELLTFIEMECEVWAN